MFCFLFFVRLLNFRKNRFFVEKQQQKSAKNDEQQFMLSNCYLRLQINKLIMAFHVLFETNVLLKGQTPMTALVTLTRVKHCGNEFAPLKLRMQIIATLITKLNRFRRKGITTVILRTGRFDNIDSAVIISDVNKTFSFVLPCLRYW